VEAKTGLALIKTSEADNIKRLGTLEGITSRFRWNGDIRLRGENYQQSCAAAWTATALAFVCALVWKGNSVKISRRPGFRHRFAGRSHHHQ